MRFHSFTYRAFTFLFRRLVSKRKNELKQTKKVNYKNLLNHLTTFKYYKVSILLHYDKRA